MSTQKVILSALIAVIISAPLPAGEPKKKSTRAKSTRPTKSKSKRHPRLDPARISDKSTVVEQRKWLKQVITFNVKSRKQKKEIVKKVDRLSEDQVADLVKLVKKRLVELRKEQLDLAKRNLAQSRSYRNQLRRRRKGVGFRPVITNVFSGASLGAGAVVSPDRRHVRLNLNPFFSQLGPVDTFNFRTGEVRRIYTPPRQRRRRPPKISYDGIRTRVTKPDSNSNRRRRRR